jgi:hypothetical protein
MIDGWLMKLQKPWVFGRVVLLVTILFLSQGCLVTTSLVPSETPQPFYRRYQNPIPIPLANQALTALEPPTLLPSPVNMTAVNMNVTSDYGYFDGYNLFELQQVNKTSGEYFRSLLITDMEGNILRNKDLGYPPEFINTTTVLTRDFNFQKIVFWNYYTDIITYVDAWGHHEVEYNAINNTVLTIEKYYREINGTPYRFDSIEEYDLDGNKIWSLDCGTFIHYWQWCPYHDRLSNGVADVTHGNTVFFDSDEDILYFNARNVNTFYKIDHKTGEVLWALGEYGNFTLFDQYGNLRDNLFYHAHSVEQVDDNIFIIFDNDLHNQTNPENKLSRILEITIDETTMTANESWTWIGPPEYYCGWFCDADRLPNGNRLGTFGAQSHAINSDIGARLVEVTDAGEIVWEMNFPHTGELRHQVYRMERFRLTPILSSPGDIVAPSGSDIITEWQAWYNFRPKRTMTGNYILYHNNTIFAYGQITYDKFWRPSNLTFNIHGLKSGLHNFTLVISDEADKITSDTVLVKISPETIEPPPTMDLLKIGMTLIVTVCVLGLAFTLSVILGRRVKQP